MNKTMKRAMLGLSMLLAAGSALANPTVSFDDYARVVRVKPVYQDLNRPVNVCNQVAYPEAPQNNNVAGEVIGGVLGGLAGHQIGRGHGNTAATIAGALGGAYLGNRVANNTQPQGPQQDCHIQYQYGRQMIGFATTFRYGGRYFTQVMPRHLHVGMMVPVRANVTVLQ